MEIPRLALGSALFTNDDATYNSVINCVEKCGYRHIDTSKDYGSEPAIGRAIHDLIERGVVKREELWVTTKLEEDCHNPACVESELRGSLERLQLDYIDLYLIHWPCEVEKREDGDHFPIYHKYNIVDLWKAMEKLVDIGLAKHIGVSNFNIGTMEKLLVSGVRIKPYVNQVEMHLYNQQIALTDYLNRHGIKIMAYSPLGCGQHEGKPVLLQDEVLKEVAAECGRPVAPVELRFLLQLGDVVVIAKSTSPERNLENSQIDFELNEDQMNRLKNRNKCLRYIVLPNFQFGDSW